MGPDDVQEFDITAPRGGGPAGSSGPSGPSGPNGPNGPSGPSRSPGTGKKGEPGGRGSAGGPGGPGGTDGTGAPDERAGNDGRDGNDGSDGAAAPRGHRPTHLWRGPVPWACCAVVLILLGIVVVPPHEAATGPWGQVEDVTTTPVQSWQRDNQDQIRAALMTRDALVLVMGQRVAGVDFDSGEELWSHPLDRGTCTTDERSIVCADGGAQVVQRAADTGAQVGQVETSGAVAATRWSGDWFVLRTGEDGKDELVRLSGTERLWSTPVRAETPETPLGNTMSVQAGRVLISSIAGTDSPGLVQGGIFDADTGERLSPTRQAEGEPFLLLQSSPGVWAAVTTTDGTLYVRGQDPVHTTSLGSRMEYDLQWDSARQPRLPPQGDGFGLFDTATGQWQWRNAESGRPIARLDGALVSMELGDKDLPMTTGRDTGTGELLWQSPGTWLECPCFGDTKTLAGFRSSLRGGSTGGITVDSRELVGVAARTGETRWTLDAPESTFALLSDGGYLIAVSSTYLRAWQLG